MDERDLVAARVLQHFQQAHKQRFGKLTESAYFTAVLYVMGAHCVDGEAAIWLQERTRRGDPYQALPIVAKTELLMNRCGLSPNHAARGVITPPHFAALNNSVAALMPRGYDDKLYLFDALFYQLGKTVHRVGKPHTEIIAALANGLNRGHPLFEVFPYSGEVFVVYEQQTGPNDHHQTGAPLEEQHLVRLRLALRQIDPGTVKKTPLQGRETFGVIDSYFREHPAPIDTLRHCFHERWVGDRTLVVLDQTSQSKNKTLLAEVKSSLTQDDLLEAVIDFSSYDVDGRPLALTAWLLNREKHTPQKTICISIRPLQEDVEGVSALQAAWFATAVCELWASPTAFRLRPSSGERLGPLKGLYLKLFDKGYEDVRGICKVMSSEDVLRANVFASKHVRHARFTTFSILNTRPLVDLILKHEKAPLCLYIIGNNGAGKSQLLSAMIGDLNDWEISSFGIAFGASDRFPLPSQSSENSRFRYLGARTGSGFSANRVERELVKSLINLCSQADRRDIFYRALETLRFRHQLYLMPEGVADEVLRIPENAHRVIELSELVNKATKPKGLMELALLRDDGRQIVRFKNLSSGEQQIIVLLAKVVSAAKRGAVLLIDEPEISLHVQWQQLLPKLFSDIARHISCVFVTATHSPTVIANATDALSHCFLAKSRELTLLSRDQRHSVETILLDGFETYTPHNREIAERCAALVAHAIRAINQPKEPHPEVQGALLRELNTLSNVMANSGDKQIPRFQQDFQLIERARGAIDETFALSGEEL